MKDRMIPCYFTLSELKHMLYMIGLAEDRYEQGDEITFNILDNIEGKIQHEEE